eukprot:TRINITY_DN2001_c0_g1_i1.p1 TRINITY_DN2001_c0_g1~~TRINITY_DN2001_c0_g1_i1.p1  ORF type:complete len:336 (-),score=72.97 TRINITY_DN2001_c0_g1_i1:66-1073(-)
MYGGKRKYVDTNSIHYFDFEDDSVKLVKSNDPPPIAFAQSLIKRNNKLYAICGCNLNQKLFYNTIHEFDLETSIWKLLETNKGEEVPEGRHGQSCLYVKEEDTFYIYGGKGLNGIFDDFWKFDFKTNSWSSIKKSDNDHGKANFQTTFLWNNLQYYFGGFNGKYYTNQMSSYDSEKNEWKRVTQRGDIPSVRDGSVSDIFQRKLYLFGGSNQIRELNDIFVLNLDTFVWKKLNFKNLEPVKEIWGSHMVVNPNNATLYCYGGFANRVWYKSLMKIRIEVLIWNTNNHKFMVEERRNFSKNFVMIHSLFKKNNSSFGRIPKPIIHLILYYANSNFD